MTELAGQLIRACGRHRGPFLGALALLGVLAALAAVFRGRFTNDLDRLFPDTRETRAVFSLLHDAHLADAIQLEFVSSSDVTRHAAYLEETARKLEKCPMLRQVTFRYRSDDPGAELASFVSLVPRFLTPEVLDECSPDAAAKNALKKLAFPAPGLVRQARMQPFGWERDFLTRLRELDEATGMRLAPEFPFFVTPDRRRAMIAAETNVRLGDADAVRRLFAELRRCAAPLPEGVELRIISGCSHTVGNEEVLKRDAAISGSVSLALFLILFLWACRGDRRALWIPLLPLYASLLALGAMTFFFREICLYVIGLGGCVTGLAVDQGIHVYAACHGKEADRRTAALALPMFLSAATSIAVFAFLGLAGIAAYLQLAVFAGLSLALSAVLALTALPLLLDKDRDRRRLFPLPASPGTGRRSAAVIVFAAAALAVPAFFRVLERADLSLESLDGTPEKIRAEELDFRRAWRRTRGETAVIAASGADGEEALERLSGIASELERRGIRPAMPPRPSRRVQAANRRAWRTPQAAEKIAKLAAACRTACRRHHLPEKFFDPFFGALTAAVASEDFALPPMLEHIDRKMIKTHGVRAAAVALLPDTPENVRTVRAVLEKRGEAHSALLSRGGFRALIRETAADRFRHLLFLSVGSAFLLMVLMLRKPGDVFLAMTPVVMAWAAVIFAAYLTGFRATPAAAFAAVLLTGLAADYGIYAVCQLRRPEELETRDPILLSAATTVAGAGALLASRHPVLFGTGAVLTPGILAACLAGVFLVPRLARPGGKKALSLLGAAVLLFLAGCAHTAPWETYPRREELSIRMGLYPDAPFRLQALTEVSFSGKRFRFVLAAGIDPGTGNVLLAGVDPGSGALLFQGGGKPGEAPRPGTVLAENAPEGLLKFLAAFPDDLRQIFISKDARPLAAEEKTEYIVVHSEKDVRWLLGTGGTVEKRGGGFFSGAWRAEYRDGGRRVLYGRRGPGYAYSLDLEIKKIWCK